MTFEELDREIELKIDELNNKKEKNRFLYISNYDEKIDTVEDFKGFNVIGFLSAYYYLHHKESTLDEVYDFLENLELLLTNIKNSEIDSLISTMLIIKKNDSLDNLKKYLYENDNISFLNILKNINATIPLKVINLKGIVTKNKININSLIDEFQNKEEQIINMLKFYQTYHKMMSIVDNIEKNNDSYNSSIFQIDNALLESDDIDKMISMIDEIEYYINDYLRISKINKKEINNLSYARDVLQENISEKEIIVNYLDIVNNIKDLKIKNMFLEVIKNHNMNYLNKLEEEYSILTKDTKLAIIALLNDYGIIKNSYNIEIIMRYSKEDIEKILKIICKLPINNDTKVTILENAIIENVIMIKEYLDRGILNNDILKDNLDMFTDGLKLENLKNSLEIIKKSNLSISLFISNIKILLEDSKLFNKNLNILFIYNLIRNIDTSQDLSYLLRNDLDKTIDKYLELGCEKYLENDLSLLNKRNLQKLELLNFLGIGVNSKEELNNLLIDDNNFDIDKKEMDVIFNKKIDIDDNTIKINLDDYIETSRVYNFDGIRVSIIKVKRLLSLGYKLYDAITYNMYLKEEEWNKLNNLLKGNSYII